MARARGAAAGGVEAAAVRAQLQRLFESPPFRSSKRCRLFLAHAVEHALAPGAEPLKERTLGVQVFGRDPAYDTAADPIIRVTAGEIRRRLGQYYADPVHQHELRIVLQAGSYTPTYGWPERNGEQPETRPEAAAAPSRRWLLAGTLSALLLGAIALIGVRAIAEPPVSSFDRFWAPLVGSQVPVLVCTGSIDVYELAPPLKDAVDSAADDGGTFEISDIERVGAGFVSVADAVAIARLAALFETQGTPYQVREKRATSFADLRTSPTVLVGMFSNAWTLQLGSDFRFVPFIDGERGAILIADRDRPDQREWRLERPWPALAIERDYALVSRVLDQDTGTMVVIGAGITPFGTVAATELLTSPAHLEAALAQAQEDWPTRNLQIVLETRVIDGVAGPPRVLATHVW